MITIAHIVNPVKVPEERDLSYAQPITFETFKVAKKFSRETVNITHYSVQYDEDIGIIPDHIEVLGNLERSLLDIGDYAYKFPFMKDIFDAVYHNSQTDYIMFSASDISLMPYFYDSVLKLINDGHDSIIINRREIPDDKKEVEDIPSLWAHVGVKHSGWDCYVFKREIYPNLNLGDIVFGARGYGGCMYTNLRFHAKKFIEVTDGHLTFHVGISGTSIRQYTDRKWMKANLHNDNQLEIILREMISKSNDTDTSKCWLSHWLLEITGRKQRHINALENGNESAPKHMGYWWAKQLKKKLGNRFSSISQHLLKDVD